jgi:SAM-dependent MidA family methyltransferase
LNLPDLPTPSTDALAHSARLSALIADEIARAGGWISFARYMELALYAPGLGYYSAGSAKLGAAGDFVTAPEISSLFGMAVAQQLGQLLRPELNDIYELGAGSGKLACDVLEELKRQDKLPEHYFIMEPSADLRERQIALVNRRIPEIVNRVCWIQKLPDRLRGLFLGNEVLDALPVYVMVLRDGVLMERGVTGGAKSGFRWAEQPAGDVIVNAAKLVDPSVLTKGVVYMSEVSLHARRLVMTLAAELEQGLLLFIDYGFPRHEYYHPQRNQGTLMCHYRHRAHDDPFFLPGLQDITAHVDFTMVRDAAKKYGVDCLGFATQAQFLINCGITDMLARVSPAEPARYLPRAAEAQKLLSPSEMGELFKVIALGKNIELPLMGFVAGDMQARLG